MSDTTRPGGVIDDRFLLVSPLGGGGAATVWRATDLTTRRDVALKLLHPKYRGVDEAHERLAREADLLARFDHPHIAHAFTFGLNRAQPYFVMRLIEGESLESELAVRSAVDEHFAWRELLRLVGQLCSAIDYAHERGVLHRDLKPSNVMLDAAARPPEVRILDFGVAKLIGESARHPTTQGRVMGTGFYMAPEQARGDALDLRADLFSLGVIVFEMVTLRRAWVRNDRGGPVRAFAEPARRNDFNTPAAILSRISREVRPRASDFRADVPASLDEALMRALAIDRADRPATAMVWYADLEAAVAAAPAVELARKQPAPRRGDVDATWSRSQAGADPTALATEVSGGWQDLGTVVDAGARRATGAPPDERLAVPGDEAGPTRVLSRATDGLRRPRAGPLRPIGRTAVVVIAAAALLGLGYALGRRSGGGSSSPDRAPNPKAVRGPRAAPKIAAEPADRSASAGSSASARSAASARSSGSNRSVGSAPSRSRAPASTGRRGARAEGARRPSGASRRRLDSLDRLWAAAQARPDDLDALGAVARGIERAAAGVADPTERARVRRMARSSSLLGDAEGVEAALAALRRALEAEPNGAR